MARATKRHKAYKSGPSRSQVAGGVFVATIVTALLSFISLELALLAFGFFGLSAITYSEIRRRQHWEHAASFKFKTGKEHRETLERTVKTHSNKLAQMEEKLEKAQARVSDTNAPAPEKTTPEEEKKRTLIAAAQSVVKERETTAIPQAALAALDNEDYDSVSDTVVLELLHNAVHNKRVDVFVQPIMRLPQRQVRFYEMFARIRAQPGQYLPAGRYMKLAEQDNLQHDIDNLLLLHCLKTIQGSAHVKRAAPFFLNITSATLKNTAFMKRVLAFVSKNRELAPRLVFEMQQADYDNMPPALLEIIRGLGTLGCRLSLDHVESFNFNVEDLQHFKVRFVKVPPKIFHEAAHESTTGGKSFTALQRSKNKLEANGIGVIVERLETETQMRALLDFDIHYGQGYLFGKPELEGAYTRRMRALRLKQQGNVA